MLSQLLRCHEASAREGASSVWVQDSWGQSWLCSCLMCPALHLSALQHLPRAQEPIEGEVGVTSVLSFHLKVPRFPDFRNVPNKGNTFELDISWVDSHFDFFLSHVSNVHFRFLVNSCLLSSRFYPGSRSSE